MSHVRRNEFVQNVPPVNNCCGRESRRCTCGNNISMEEYVRTMNGLAMNAATDDDPLELPTINGHDDEEDDYGPGDGLTSNAVGYAPGDDEALGLPVINWSLPPDGSPKPRGREGRDYRSRDVVHNRGDDALELPSVDWSRPV